MPRRSSTAPPTATIGMNEVRGFRRSTSMSWPPAQPLDVEIHHDQPRHGLHQHLRGLEPGRHSGHRMTGLFQGATKRAPRRGIGVGQ